MFICAKKTGFFEVALFFSYLKELQLFQFAVISLVRDEVICFSTFLHTFKNFTAQVVELYVSFASASAKS